MMHMPQEALRAANGEEGLRLGSKLGETQNSDMSRLTQFLKQMV